LLISQRVVLVLGILHLVLVVLAHFHVVHRVVVDLLVDSHSCLVLFSRVMLHLHLTRVFQVLESLVHFLLSHPLFEALGAILLHYLEVTVDGFLDLRVTTKLCHLVRLVQLLCGQPGVHVGCSGVMSFLFLFGVLKQLLSHFPFVLVYQFLFQTFLGVLLAHPLLEVGCIFVGVHAPSGGTLVAVGLEESEFGARANRSLVGESLKQNI